MARKTLFARLLAAPPAACGSSGEDAAVGTWRPDTVAAVTANHSRHRNAMMKIADGLGRVAGVATGDRLRQDVAMEMPQVERELQAMAEADAQEISISPHGGTRAQGVIATFSTPSRWLPNRSYASSMSSSL